MWPDAPALRAYFARTSRRLTVLAVAQGAAIGLGVALAATVAVAMIGWSLAPSREMVRVGMWLGVGGLVAGIVVAAIRRRRSAAVAIQIERRAPTCRNVVITAAELMLEPRWIEPYIGEMVCREAARQVERLDPAMLFPARRAVATLSVVSVAWVAFLMVVAARPAPNAPPIRPSPPSSGFAVVDDIEIVVTPPAYSGQPVRTLRDPTRIEALAGSRLHVTVRADVAAVAIETLSGRTGLTTADNHAFTGDVVADADGFVALEPSTPDGHTGARRLIGLSVTPDRSPRVKITAPGKDMFLTDANRALDVALEADDDLGLASLTLRYTKVSGSGEKFSFVEGEVPVAITRSDTRAWRARGTLKLDALKLAQGDIVVYRGVATDKRPGAPPTESDAFIVEITSPGRIASEGFSMDDRQDKYALSQQMVILKTERLLAKASAMPTDSLRDHSQTIAAEQRAVRAEFVFMMGGELAEEVIAAAGMTDLNEEAEAAGEADLAAGRMVNRGRVALVQAIRFMSRANASLNTVDLTKALTEEKAGLTYLQQAFSRTRYLLRALTQRERLDLSRRLTGVLATAARDARAAPIQGPDPKVTALRRALSGIATLAADPTFDRTSGAPTALLAQRVLEIDPSDSALHIIVTQLLDAASAFNRGKRDDARRNLDDAATRLASVIRAALLQGPGQSRPAEISRLRGELSDELRRARVGR